MKLSNVKDAAARVGVARSTLLYYEKLGLVSPQRHTENRYRLYDDAAINRLIMLRQLQKAGLSLKECRDLLEGRLEAAVLQRRVRHLETEIQNLEQARHLLKALLRENGSADSSADHIRKWHQAFETRSAAAHDQWLRQQGFTEKESIHIRWVSRNMENHNTYMQHFMAVFENMNRQGPGSRATARKVLELLPEKNQMRSVLDIGCGKGDSSLFLAEETGACITALDNHQPFLDDLEREAQHLGFSEQITTLCASMLDLPLDEKQYDLIWCEGAAYFLGVEKALEAWQPMLKPGGCLFISDAVWKTETPSPECRAYWAQEYPQMITLEARCRQAEKAGYEVLSRFMLPDQDWIDFYDDMKSCRLEAEKALGAQQAFEDMKHEDRVGRRYLDEYGYGCLLLRKRSED